MPTATDIFLSKFPFKLAGHFINKDGMLSFHKYDKLPTCKGAVYLILEDNEVVDIGETGRSLQARISSYCGDPNNRNKGGEDGVKNVKFRRKVLAAISEGRTIRLYYIQVPRVTDRVDSITGRIIKDSIDKNAPRDAESGLTQEFMACTGGTPPRWQRQIG